MPDPSPLAVMGGKGGGGGNCPCAKAAWSWSPTLACNSCNIPAELGVWSWAWEVEAGPRGEDPFQAKGLLRCTARLSTTSRMRWRKVSVPPPSLRLDWAALRCVKGTGFSFSGRPTRVEEPPSVSPIVESKYRCLVCYTRQGLQAIRSGRHRCTKAAFRIGDASVFFAVFGARLDSRTPFETRDRLGPTADAGILPAPKPVPARPAWYTGYR